MTENHRCNRCGELIPSDAPEGTCPACMPRTDLEPAAQPTGVSAGGQATCDFELAQPGHVLESLARSIGSIPRVLLPETGADETSLAITNPSSDTIPAPAERSDRYQFFGEIARGGMGAVLRGRDPDLGRDLAVKVLLESHEDKPEMLRRFVEEAQIGGQLQHPGIVPVYELGTFADRRPYFTMKLVKGRTLSALLAERPSPAHDLPRFFSIFEAICQTVAYSHARGVIHRDLKPSNVMVGSFGEVQVMDWGLAKVLKESGIADQSPDQPAPEESLVATVRSGSNQDESQAGSVLGTPAYMAPEQAAGDIVHVDRRSDVFGLGSILCEILTGQPAYTGHGAVEILRKAMRGDTADALARLDGCGAEAELVALARDCLAVGPENRPRDAGLVAKRITAYLAGVQERVQAAERERAVAVAKAIEERRRRKVQLALAASILALTTLGGLSTTYYLQQRAAQVAAGERVIDQVTTLQGQALAQPEDIQRWEVALAAVEQADPAGDPSSLAQLRTIREQIQAGLEAARRDQKLLDRLIDIRSAADDPDGSTTDAAYADAFREARIDLASLRPAEAGSKIKARPASVALALAAALDDWAAVRRSQRRDAAGAARLTAAARDADPDPWRNELRTAFELPDKSASLARFQALARTARGEERGALSLRLLGTALHYAGDSALAESVLRPAQQKHPGDAWVNFALATVLEKLARPDEAIRFYTVARAFRPETAHELAQALVSRGNSDEAIAVFRDLTERRPGDAVHLTGLARTLHDKGLSREADAAMASAEAASREEIRKKPDDFASHLHLAGALADRGKQDEAIVEIRTAIVLEPGLAMAHFNLGFALEAQGKRDEAISEFRDAIRLKVDYADAHRSLGRVLVSQGKLDEGIAEIRTAIRLEPDLAIAHSNLGATLANQGKLDEAIAEYRTAIRLEPDDAVPHSNLGLALQTQDKPDEAIAEYRMAIRLKPDYAQPHCNLGNLLGAQGLYAESLDLLRKGHELGSRSPGWRNPSAHWVADAERRLAMANQSPGVLRGEDKPRDNAERLAGSQDTAAAKAPSGKESENRETTGLEVAVAGLRNEIRLRPDDGGLYSNYGRLLGYLGRHEEAIEACRKAIKLNPNDGGAHLNLGYSLSAQGQLRDALAAFGDAERLDPSLIQSRQWQLLYFAACTAAKAAAGKGKDEPPPDDAAKVKLRQQALDWLRAEYKAWRQLLESGGSQGRPFIAAARGHWQQNGDLAGIRDDEALARLPEAERKEWQALWADVVSLRPRGQHAHPNGPEDESHRTTRAGRRQGGQPRGAR